MVCYRNGTSEGSNHAFLGGDRGQPSPGRNLQQVCPFCPESPQQPQVISSMASVNYGPWSARAVVHPQPLYHVEGDPGRRGVGFTT